jgi:Ca2+/Na+ antiporter
MLPIIIHIAAVVVITALFIIGYIRQRYLYQLLFAIWAPTTLLRYLSNNKIYLIVLGVVQLLMFFLVIFALFRGRKEFDKDEPSEAAREENSLVDEDPADPVEEKLAEQEPEDPAASIQWENEQNS